MHISVALSTFHNVKPSPLSTPRIILSPQKERRGGSGFKKKKKCLLFQLLSLWNFVTAVLENQHNYFDTIQGTFLTCFFICKAGSIIMVPPPGLHSKHFAQIISFSHHIYFATGFLGSSGDKDPVCSVGDQGSIPGLGRSPGEGNGNQLQYPCLENPMDRGAWWAPIYGVIKSWTQLSD